MALNPLRWFSSLYYDYLAPFLGLQKKATILFMGLDGAGKTTLLYRLKDGRMTQAAPTLLPHCEQLSHGGVTFTTYDIGGHKQARIVWRTYLPVADGIIFIIDGADKERLGESAAELSNLLYNEDISGVPVAVLINKIDQNDAVGEHEIISLCGLYGRTTGKDYGTIEELEGTRPLEVFPCSILLRQGYSQALKWLAHYVKQA